MSFKFSAENIVLANKEIAKYPKGKERSAVMALLKIAQHQNNNFLTKDIFEYIANYLNIPVVQVEEVASFYTMYNLKPMGKYHLQVCNNLVCNVRGSENLIQVIEEVSGAKLGATSVDGMFTLSQVECLGACANAPVIQINDDYFEDVNKESLINVINLLKTNQKVEFNKSIKAPIQLATEPSNVSREG